MLKLHARYTFDSDTDTTERTETVRIDDNEDSESPDCELVSETEITEETVSKSALNVSQIDDDTEDTNDSVCITEDDSNIRNNHIQHNNVTDAENNSEIDELPNVDTDNEVDEVEVDSHTEVETVQDSSESNDGVPIT